MNRLRSRLQLAAALLVTFGSLAAFAQPSIGQSRSGGHPENVAGEPKSDIPGVTPAQLDAIMDTARARGVAAEGAQPDLVRHERAERGPANMVKPDTMTLAFVSPDAVDDVSRRATGMALVHSVDDDNVDVVFLPAFSGSLDGRLEIGTVLISPSGDVLASESVNAYAATLTATRGGPGRAVAAYGVQICTFFRIEPRLVPYYGYFVVSESIISCALPYHGLDSISLRSFFGFSIVEIGVGQANRPATGPTIYGWLVSNSVGRICALVSYGVPYWTYHQQVAITPGFNNISDTFTIPVRNLPCTWFSN